MNYPDYGYVWQPNTDADFKPYATNGNWVYSDYGWTWSSDYSWGWAPFHYGRWFYDNSYGWLWMPGHDWAPAWVTWSQSGDYYGWAPVPPRVELNNNWRPRNEDWNFVQANNITYNNVNRYVVKNNVTVINRITIINNVTNNNVTNNYTVNNNNTVIYNRGPRVNDVENVGHNKIQQVKINEGARPGQSFKNNQLIIYRPLIKQNVQQANDKPAPRKVMNYNNDGRQNQRPGNMQGGIKTTDPGRATNPASKTENREISS
ncbi:DUF6600 domain-containing protein [Mucilaginibacter gotjawali]|nr:DUF6600 domain-containing protein [Mucilaginibacter gotjawali]